MIRTDVRFAWLACRRCLHLFCRLDAEIARDMLRCMECQ